MPWEGVNSAEKGRHSARVSCRPLKLKRFDSLIQTVSRAINVLGMAIILAMMLLVVADVVMRYVFHSPIQGATELIELMLVVVVFFGLAHTQIMKGHIAVDFVVARLSRRGRAMTGVIVHLLSFALFIVVTWENLLEANAKMASGETTHLLFIPIPPFLYSIAFGCFMLSLVLLINLVFSLAEALKK